MPPVADILSTLPNPLLGLILSKIPIREAVRCSVLSKRWKFLYTQIPQLTLSPILLVPTTSRYPDPDSVATVETIISNLLMLHSADIEAFHLFTYYLQFTSESVWQWVTYAASRNVQHLTLCDSPKEYSNFFTYNPGREIPPALFSCTHLATLRLSNYNFKHLPTHFSGFKHLITCSFEGMQFTDEFLSCFISHSPFLQKLTLHRCIGLRKPVISAPDLTHLSVNGMWEALTVNCPKFRTLEMVVTKIGDLRINGVMFQELSYLVSKIKMQCGSNVAVLWLTNSGYASVERVLEIVGNFKTLKKLVINDMWESQSQMVVFVDNLLERLPGLTRLRVTSMFDLGLVRDPILPCGISLLGNIRKVKVCININRFDTGEITILDKLLKRASVLETLEVELPCLCKGHSAVGTASSEEWKANALQKLLNLKSGCGSTRARICLTFEYCVS